MSNLSTILLREEIKRINNLNKRIDESSFIIEATLDTDTEKILVSDIRGALLKKGIDDTVVDEYIDKTLRPNFTSGQFCGSGLKCKDFATYILKAINKSKDKNIHVKLWQRIEKGNKTTGALQQHVQKVLAKQISPLAAIASGGPQVPAGVKTLTDAQIPNFLQDYYDIQKDLVGWKIKPDFNKFIKELTTKLKDGTYCQLKGGKDLCGTIDDMEKVKDLHILELEARIKVPELVKDSSDAFLKTLEDNREEIKQTQRMTDADFDAFIVLTKKELNDGTFITKHFPDFMKRMFDTKGKQDYSKVPNEVKRALIQYRQKKKQEALRPVDIVNLMKRWDSNIQAGLVENLGGEAVAERQADEIREEFKKSLEEGTICEACETRAQTITKAEESMDLILKYSGTKIPEGIGRFDFLQGKIDKLLVMNSTADSDKEDGEEKVISHDQLKEFSAQREGKKFEIEIVGDDKLKDAFPAFMESNKKMEGHFVEWNGSKHYTLFQAFDKGKIENLQFVIQDLQKGLIYPKTHSVYVKKKGKDGKWVQAAPAPFRMKIKSIKEKS